MIQGVPAASILTKKTNLSIQKAQKIKAKRRNERTQEFEYLVEWKQNVHEQGQGGNGTDSGAWNEQSGFSGQHGGPISELERKNGKVSVAGTDH